MKKVLIANIYFWKAINGGSCRFTMKKFVKNKMFFKTIRKEYEFHKISRLLRLHNVYKA